MGRYYGPDQYSSITTVLGVFARFEGVPRDVLSRKAALGSAVHKITAALDKGITWFPGGIHQRVALYVEGWKLFVADHIDHFIYIERPMISEVFKFGGTGDRLGVLKGKRFPIPIQLKTSVVIDRYINIQVAAETILFEENYRRKVDKRGIAVQLMPNDYKIHPLFETDKDFFDALTAWNYALWLYHYLNESK